MMKPSIPKGTRDFGTIDSLKRDYLFGVIKDCFVKYAFQKIETPALENLSTLTGKYGEEGDKLVFKVLNNGDFLSKVDEKSLESKNSNEVLKQISKRGLRYDLTVPFARFVTMHQNDLSFPFKRYQIQPVWRADRPQKGRYQEFYQCDADVVGSDSLLYEADFLRIFDEVFASFGLDVTIHYNNRKILSGIVEIAGLSDHFEEVVIILDKWDKIGQDQIKEQLLSSGLNASSVDKLISLVKIDSLQELGLYLASSNIGTIGVQELVEINNYNDNYSFRNKIYFDPKLARGLDYYTGCIYEVKANNSTMGSIASGGRYDNLTEVFGLKGTSGVGVSFGAERIFDLLEEKDLFPKESKKSLDLLLIALDQDSLAYIFKQIKTLRDNSEKSIDFYPEVVKMKKSMKYADQRGVSFVGIMGEEERKKGMVSLKNMQSGEQELIPFHDITSYLNEHIK